MYVEICYDSWNQSFHTTHMTKNRITCTEFSVLPVLSQGSSTKTVVSNDLLYSVQPE